MCISCRRGRACVHTPSSVCIHLVIWINGETRAGLPTAGFNYSRCFWPKTRSPRRIRPAAAAAASVAVGHFPRGGGGRNGDSWKGDTSKLLSAVCSPKQAEWIIQWRCITPRTELPCRGIINKLLGDGALYSQPRAAPHFSVYFC